MNPILEAALCRDEFTRRNAVQLRIPRLFWYLRSRRARWLRQGFNTLLWMALAAWLMLALNACTNANSAVESSPAIALHRQGDVLQIPPDSPLRPHLHLDKAISAPVHDTLTSIATVEALPQSLLRIIPPMAGRILRLYVQTGDAVNAGDILASFHSAEISALRGEHAKAVSALRLAEQEYARQQTLFEADIAARREFEAAQLELDSAHADVRAMLSALNQIGISADTLEGAEYLMRSPINGLVLDLNGAPGSYWNDTSDALMTVADLRTLWLSAHLPEHEITRIAIGQQATITFSAQPSLQLTGKVQYIGNIIDPESRSIKVRVAVDNPNGQLRPGMFAQVDFAAPPREAVMIPASALLQGHLQHAVWTETSEGHFRLRAVKPGILAGGQIEIRAGLSAGERVIANAVEFLQ